MSPKRFNRTYKRVTCKFGLVIMRRKILKGSKIRVLDCKEGRHLGSYGTVDSKRLDKGWNIILQHNVRCVAYRVKVFKYAV